MITTIEKLSAIVSLFVDRSTIGQHKGAHFRNGNMHLPKCTLPFSDGFIYGHLRFTDASLVLRKQGRKERIIPSEIMKLKGQQKRKRMCKSA